MIKIWDRRLLGKQADPVGVMVGHLEGITHINSKGDGRYFISNSKDQSIKLWDLRAMVPPKEGETKARVGRGRSGFDYRYGDVNWGRAQRNVMRGKVYLYFMPLTLEGTVSNPHDVSLMTYRSHKVFQTLIRAYFSPLSTTGQRYIYTGSYDGTAYSKHSFLSG
jgi:WD repeat-containing protein 23